LQTARYFLDLGIIGTPIMGVIRLTRSYQLTMEDRKDAPARFSLLSRGGGIPYDMSGYYLHGLFNMFGPVARACGFSYTTGGERPYLNPRHSRFNETYIVDTENAVCAALEFKNGFRVAKRFSCI
jgi:predicted dehydrogenase